MGKIYGIGVGPGNKKYLTLQAVEVLNSVDYIFVPKNRDKNMALDAVIDLIDSDKLNYLEYPMKHMTTAGYIKNAETISKLLSGDKSGAFITIGDPMFYSTVMNTFALLDESIEVEYISGIPSFVYGAAACKRPLAFTGEALMVLDHVPEKFIDGIDNYVIMKTYDLDLEKLDFIEESGFEYSYIEKGSLEDELILENKEEILTRKAYMSLLILRRRSRTEKIGHKEENHLQADNG